MRAEGQDMRHRSTRPHRAYAAIPNAAMRDQRLSIEARGLLALLMTYSDDWVFRVDHLQKVATCGRDVLRRMLKELERAGYMVREVERGSSGRVAGTQWIIVDDPFDTKPCATDDDAEQAVVDDDVRRPPENPSLGKNAHTDSNSVDMCIHTDSLKNRPPEKPTAGKTDPLRRTKEKKTNYKNPPDPKPAFADIPDETEIAMKWVGAVKAGHSFAASAIRPSVARKMLALKLVSSDELRSVGVAF